jgi:hypothetical protein
MSRFRIPVIIALVGLVLASCGGSNNSKALIKGAPTGKSGSGNSGFDALIGKSKNATYKAVYNSGGSEITIVNLPPASAYINGDTGYYQDAAGTTTVCNGTGSSATCTEAPAGAGPSVTTMMQGMFGAYGALLTTSAASVFLNVQTSEKTIAGRQAKCAKIDASKFGSAGSVEVCADAELGILLSMNTTDSSGKQDSQLEATSVSTNPTQADVTPPASPQTTTSAT